MIASRRLHGRVLGTVILLVCLAGCGSGSPSQPTGTTTTTTTTTPTLSSVSLGSSSVVGGNSVQGTVTLSAAPSSATTVTLASSNAAAAPGNATVNPGSTNGTFSVSTTTVSASTPVTITATLNGVNQQAQLTVTPQPLTASFTVTSLSPALRKDGSVILPAGSANACPLINNGGNPILDCRFDGSASTPSGSIKTYLWTYLFGSSQKDENTTTSLFKPTASGCGFFSGRSPGTDGSVQFIQLVGRLQVQDAAGNLSSTVSNQDIRVFPAGLCGYGF